MSTASAALVSTSDLDGETCAQRVVVVYNCSRIGLRANPPRPSFADFFRFGRRRR